MRGWAPGPPCPPSCGFGAEAFHCTRSFCFPFAPPCFRLSEVGWDADICQALSLQGCCSTSFVMVICLCFVLPVPNYLLRLGLITPSGLEGIFSVWKPGQNHTIFPPQPHACCQKVWLLCQRLCKRQFWITVQTGFVKRHVGYVVKQEFSSTGRASACCKHCSCLMRDTDYAPKDG